MNMENVLNQYFLIHTPMSTILVNAFITIHKLLLIVSFCLGKLYELQVSYFFLMRNTRIFSKLYCELDIGTQMQLFHRLECSWDSLTILICCACCNTNSFNEHLKTCILYLHSAHMLCVQNRQGCYHHRRRRE